MTQSKFNMPNKSITVSQYFMATSFLSALLIICYVGQDDVLRRQVSGFIGLQTVLEAKEDSFFEQRVKPIFTEYCLACHNESKAKGKLRLDRFIYARYSGKSGPSVVPHDVSSSHLIERMLLDENDKRLMPPLGWKRLSADELQILILWIEKGASPVLSAKDFPTAPKQVIDIDIPSIDLDKVKLARRPLEVKLQNINTHFPHAISYVARDSAYLRFTNVSVQGKFTDSQFALLTEIAPFITSLYLRNTQITEASANVLLTMTHVSDVYLDGANIEEKTLITFIKNQSSLKQLSVPITLISDEIKQLCEERDITLGRLPNV